MIARMDTLCVLGGQASRSSAHAAEIQRYIELSRAERLAASQVADLRHRKADRIEQGKAWTERQEVRRHSCVLVYHALLSWCRAGPRWCGGIVCTLD